MAIYIRNCYSVPSRLFVLGGTEILTSEGTTQGDPLFTMPVYAIGITFLLEILKPETSDVTTLKHVAFADDLGGAGDLLELRRWWDNIVNCGPKLGYNPNASKSWLIVKPEVQTKAREIFRGTKINITTEGRKYLGGYIGSEDGWDEYADELVNSCCGQLMVLSKIAKIEPQAAYAAFVSGFKHQVTYYIRTTPNIKQHLTRLDAMTTYSSQQLQYGHLCTTDEQLLLSLPVRKGSLAIPIFSTMGDFEFASFRAATEQLVDHIIIQSRQHSTSGYRTTQDHKKKNRHCQRRAEQQSPTATT